MAKSVNINVLTIRNGVADARNFKGVSYARLVAVESALAAAMGALAAWGSRRVAATADGKKPASGAGETDIEVRMNVDFVGGGGASFSVGYSGISATDADQVLGILNGALSQSMS